MSLLEIKDLVIHFHTDEGTIEAVTGVDLSMEPGESLGLVGETGAGKSTTALGIMRLVPDPPGKTVGGQVLFEGTDLLRLPMGEMRAIRGAQISMIFQDPMTALNPILTVGEQIAEGIALHTGCGRSAAHDRAGEMLELVGIPRERMDEYPHQFSGGMKQRVVIAIALACRPKLLIADEPTTALDVTIQAQVLETIVKLQKQLGTAMLLITHDLGVVAEVCDKVAVMYAGQIVENGSAEDIFERPAHPYTMGLFGSLPSFDQEVSRLSPIQGMMPDPADLPPGCRFHPRCPRATEVCKNRAPDKAEIGPGHWVQCHHAEER